jgi:hypothetical protein
MEEEAGKYSVTKLLSPLFDVDPFLCFCQLLSPIFKYFSNLIIL